MAGRLENRRVPEFTDATKFNSSNELSFSINLNQHAPARRGKIGRMEHENSMRFIADAIDADRDDSGETLNS
jgi:hypothetical protein